MHSPSGTDSQDWTSNLKVTRQSLYSLMKKIKHLTGFLKQNTLELFRNLEIEMLKKGWHLAYLANTTRWCIDEDLDLKKKFADYLRNEYNLHDKCVPVGMSCGGMIAVKFAARHPQYISCLYLDAPVMNLLSCPCGIGDATTDLYEEYVAVTGKTRSDLINYREHPVDKIPALLEHHIPVVLVYGDSDPIVPYHENGMELENQYRAKDGTLLVLGKKNCGHHPHGLEDPTPIIQFILQYA